MLHTLRHEAENDVAGADRPNRTRGEASERNGIEAHRAPCTSKMLIQEAGGLPGSNIADQVSRDGGKMTIHNAKLMLRAGSHFVIDDVATSLSLGLHTLY